MGVKMENWYALHEMRRQIHREQQLEAQKIRMVQQLREFDMKNSKKMAKKRQRRLLNFIGKSLETFGRSLQKKSQTC